MTRNKSASGAWLKRKVKHDRCSLVDRRSCRIDFDSCFMAEGGSVMSVIPSRSALCAQIENVRALAKRNDPSTSGLILKLCQECLDLYDAGDNANAFRLFVFVGGLTTKDGRRRLEGKLRELCVEMALTMEKNPAGDPSPELTELEAFLGNKFVVNPDLQQFCFHTARSTDAKAVVLAILHSKPKGPAGETLEMFVAMPAGESVNIREFGDQVKKTFGGTP